MASALFMGALAVALSFFPGEVMKVFNIPPDATATLFLQLTGALYFGIAMLNWMAKTVLIGGIYARPLGLGNFAHFFIGAMALLKFAFKSTDSLHIWAVCVAYCFFAAWFGWVTFASTPKNISK